MKRRKTFSLIAIVLFGLTGIETKITLAASVKSLSVEILEKQTEEVDSIQNDIVNLEEENQYLNHVISINEENKTELEKMIQEKEKQVDTIQNAINIKTQAYEDNMAVAKERMVALQVSNSSFGAQFIKSLLKAENFNDWIGRTYRVTVLLNSHTSFINQLVQEHNQIEVEKQLVRKEKKEIEQNQQEVENLLIQLEIDKESSQKKIEEFEVKKLQLIEKLETDKIAYQTLQEERNLVIEEPPLQKEITFHSTEEMLHKPTKSNISDVRDILETTLRVSRSDVIKQIVKDATSLIGVPYKWGGSTPSGFDCSGLIQYVYMKSGISLPRVTTAQEEVGTNISFEELEPGDLLFWGKRGETYHNAIYIGDEQFIHAPQPGKNVQIMTFSEYMPSFAKRIIQKELPTPPISPEKDKNELTPHDIDMLG